MSVCGVRSKKRETHGRDFVEFRAPRSDGGSVVCTGIRGLGGPGVDVLG